MLERRDGGFAPAIYQWLFDTGKTMVAKEGVGLFLHFLGYPFLQIAFDVS